jgi:hypothetical protein
MTPGGGAGFPRTRRRRVGARLVGGRFAARVEAGDRPEQVARRLEREVAARRVGYRERDHVTARAQLRVLLRGVRHVNPIGIVHESWGPPTSIAQQHRTLRGVRRYGRRGLGLRSPQVALDAQVLIRILRSHRVAQLTRVPRAVRIVARRARGRRLVVGRRVPLDVVRLEAPAFERPASLVTANARWVRCARRVQIGVS